MLVTGVRGIAGSVHRAVARASQRLLSRFPLTMVGVAAEGSVSNEGTVLVILPYDTFRTEVLGSFLLSVIMHQFSVLVLAFLLLLVHRLAVDISDLGAILASMTASKSGLRRTKIHHLPPQIFVPASKITAKGIRRLAGEVIGAVGRLKMATAASGATTGTMGGHVLMGAHTIMVSSVGTTAGQGGLARIGSVCSWPVP